MLFLTFGLGNVFLIISRIFSNRLTNFELGFLEGLSVVFILIGASYLT